MQTIFPGSGIDPFASLSAVIAEEALALLEALAVDDIDELRFRGTLLVTHAQDTGQDTLAAALISLLDTSGGWPDFARRKQLVTRVERVISAAADVVTAHAARDCGTHDELRPCLN
jgi:hypothetical protein